MATKKQIQHIYTLTPLQEGILFHALFDQNSNPYFEQCHFRLKGFLDVERFEHAWNEVMQRHDVLRTRFVYKNVSKPRQIVLKEQKIIFEFQDLMTDSEDQQENSVETYKKRDLAKGFDLAKDVLMRMTVFRLNEKVFDVVHSFHHILLDGWSVGILHEESFHIYESLTQNRHHNLPPALGFGTYIRWLGQQDKNSSEQFWKNYLTDYTKATFLPGHDKRKNQPFLAQEKSYSFSKTLTDGLHHLAARHRVTQNSVIQTLWGLLLGHYNQTHDVLFTATVSGRPPEILGVEKMVGLFINAIPVRIQGLKELPFDQLLKQVQKEASTAKEYHNHSLAEILANSGLNHDFLDHIMVFENYVSEDMTHFSIDDSKGGQLLVERYKQVDHSNYPLTVQVLPGERLGFNMILNQTAIKPELVDEMVFNLQTILEQVILNDTIHIDAIKLPTLTGVRSTKTTNDSKKIPLTITATFTAEPIEPHIRWWSDQFDLAIDVLFSPYNQVFQELLNPIYEQYQGYTLLLVRFEDWIRDINLINAQHYKNHLQSYYEKLTQILTTKTHKNPLMVGLLPLQHPLKAPEGTLDFISELYKHFIVFIKDHPTLHLLDMTNLGEFYLIDDMFDQNQDQTGHIPFSDSMNASMGLCIARRIHSNQSTPFKVIALDCDNTLWNGICGEQGISVEVTENHQKLQRFMIQKLNEGFLLVLNSKNNEQDVWDVFQKNPDMVLQQKHIVSHRINWNPKSTNLREMALELDLGVDSFIFIDDSGLECSEVMSNLPEVLTLKLPEDPNHFFPFFNHIWAFDRFEVTKEDQKRSKLYQEERERRQIQQTAPSLEDFLKTLEIQIFMEPMAQKHQARVSQLTQRTNQFNVSTIRRTEHEIQSLNPQDGWRCWCVHVQDRFGDYGLVGVVISQKQENNLFVDTLLLSCRVLGRDVEKSILNGLKLYCQENDLKQLLVNYRPTPKNRPALAFLDNSPLKPTKTTQTSTLYVSDVSKLPEQSRHAHFFYEMSPPIPASADAQTDLSSEPEKVESIGDNPLFEQKGTSLGALPQTPLGRDNSLPRPIPINFKPNSSQSFRWSSDLVNEKNLIHKSHYQPLIYNTGKLLLNIPIHDSIQRDSIIKPTAPLQGEHQHQMALIWQEVLGCGHLGRHDSFFELGGHSLMAVRIVSSIQKQFDVLVQLSDLFEHPTIESLCNVVRNQKKLHKPPIPPIEHKENYPVSHAQLRLWILQQMESNAIAYNTASLYEFRGDLNGDWMEKSLHWVAERHESLRTTFIQEKNRSQIRQRIHPDCMATLLKVDLTHEKNPEKKARSLALEDARIPFDLELGPLYRITLMRLNPKRHILLLNMHHIISDGWSMEILQNETMTHYESLMLHKPLTLKPLSIHYKDYAAYQNSRQNGPEAETAKAYWHQKLKKGIQSLSLPTDFPRPKIQTFNGRIIVHHFEEDSRDGLHQLGIKHQATLFMVLTSLIKIILLRHSEDPKSPSNTGDKEIIIGTPVAGREEIELDEQIGLYLNTLALHDCLNVEDTFATVLSKVKQTITEASKHQLYPFDRLLEELNLERDMSRSPLFDVMVVMQDLMPEKPNPPGLTISAFDVDAQISRFDLVFDFFEKENTFRVAVTYNTDLFLAERIQRMLLHLTVLTRSVLNNPHQSIKKLTILPHEEQNLLLESFNANKKPFPENKTIIDLFQDQVLETPSHLAILETIHGVDHTINYKQLDTWSTQIAQYLKTSLSVKQEEIIGLFMDRSSSLYASLLGIMKSGAACLPIDPSTPQERVDFMISDSGCRILLVEKKNVSLRSPVIQWEIEPFLVGTENNHSLKDKMINLGALPQTPLGRDNSLPRPIPITFKNKDEQLSDIGPHSLAYVIYTSGSTGRPKGVLVEHGGFVNMSLAQIKYFGITQKDRVLQFASPSFDASLSEIFMALLCGATLVPVHPKTIQNPDQFLKQMERMNITVITLPPIYLNTLITHSKKLKIPLFTTLKTVITAGEPPLIEDALYMAKTLNYFNAYGPTETSVCATMYSVQPDPTLYTNGIPIGKPLDNLSIYILDEHNQPVPIGVNGELSVSGPGVARGYLNQPLLTSQHFIPNPFQTNKKMYKTGDLGRWKTDGSIELLGRIDEQVKIRGHRVEPDEVSHHLRNYPHVEEAVVLTQKTSTNTTELIAFITPNTLQPEPVVRWLTNTLPGFMVPSKLIPLEKIPVTINGKIDRKSLLKQMDSYKPIQQCSHTETTELENRLLKVWQKILGRHDINLLDDFFILGGDSIKAIQLVSSLSDLNLETKDLFIHPTISSLSNAIESGSLNPNKKTKTEIVEGPIPLTPIQHWFFKEYPVDQHHFNHAEFFFFHEQLNETILYKTLQTVQKHHDMLRARFYLDSNNTIIQDIHNQDNGVDFEMVDLSLLQKDQAENTITSYTKKQQSSFNLKTGPLLKTRLFRLLKEDRLLIVIHHLIIDAVSWRFLMDDILRVYEQLIQEKPIELPRKSSSFKQWSEGIKQYSQSLKLMREKSYWQQLESVTVLDFPGTFKNPLSISTKELTQNIHLKDQTITLSEKETQSLISTLSSNPHLNLIDVMLYSMAHSIHTWCGMETIPLLLEGHGRENVVDSVDVSRTLGWFTTVFPVILTLSPSHTQSEGLKSIHNTLAKIPQSGIGYGILNHITPQSMKKEMTFNLKPKISFNYLGEYQVDSRTLSLKTTTEIAEFRVSDKALILYDLIFNAIIENNTLQIFLAYNSNRFEDSTIQSLLNEMQQSLTIQP